MIKIPFLYQRHLNRLKATWEAAKAEVKAAEAVRDTRRIHTALERCHAACKDYMRAELAR